MIRTLLEDDTIPPVFNLTALLVFCYSAGAEIDSARFSHRNIKMSDNPPNEQRTSKRIPFYTEVQVAGVGMRRSLDLSIGGMYLETVATFPVGTLLDLRFKLQGSDQEDIHVQARVLYSHPGIGVGVAFVNLPHQESEKILKWIEAH
jgi:hypothetical protein